jgi:TolB-like protein/DNA-binding winged helix-turn-helix (wHTH) protein/Flp pilus assembly protein TadD
MLNFVPPGAVLEPLRQTSVLRFGTYEIGLQSGELRKAGVRIRIQQQPLKLLEILLERPGEVVTREELRNRMWPNESFGDFDQAVNVAIAKLRAAIGDSADNPRYVETLPRRGYRFIADVAVIDPPPNKLDLTAEPNSSATADTSRPGVEGKVPGPKPLSSRHARTVVVAMVLLLAMAAVWIFLWKSGSQANSSPSSPIRSLAVLPLENLSSDSEDYFADGMTDELITDLAQISALRVISRTSIMPYKGVRKPLLQIASELNVDAVVEGTVLRSGSRVRITAQLIRASVDKHLWAQSYEGDVRDTLALQKKVAREIADQIRIKLTPREAAVLGNAKPVNPEAYENYLKGRYFWSKRTADDTKKAIDYFNRAIQSDPNYALPHAGLADIYQISDRPQLAREEVQKALDLDDQSAEAHNSLANLLYLFNHDWEGADKEFKRALELDHNYAPAHHWYSMYLALRGRKEEALAEAEEAYELDPLSPVVGANLAKILQEAGQDDKAIEQAKKTLDMEPDSAVTHAVLGVVYQDKKMYAEAITEYKRALEVGGPPTEIRGLLGYAYAVSGNRSEAEKTIAQLKKLLPEHTRAALDLAVVFSGLGDKSSALYWLDKALEAHVTDMIGIGQDPHFAELRSDPHFQAMVQRVGTPR